MTKLTHVDDSGSAYMVDVSDKSETVREAIAEGFIAINSETLEAIRNNTMKKGDVLAVARIAGIMAAKKTSELIPLCHPLALTKVNVDFSIKENGIEVRALTKLTGKTGVEIEAITAASVALITIYDMAKAMQKDMVISDIRLISKSGGKSGDWSAI